MRDPAFQFGGAAFRAPFLSIQRLVRNNEPLQFAARLGFGAAQLRQLMRGDRLPPGGLGLGPGFFRDVPQIGFEFGFGRLKHARRLAPD